MGSITEKEKLMFEFIQRTDRKSLYTQVKQLVTRAEQCLQNELNVRRDRLRRFLAEEDRLYEEEFSDKVKHTMDEEIKARHDGRLKMRDDAVQSAVELLKVKRIQQRMGNCPEIREAIRKREIRNTKQIQLEQIAERERKVAQEREEDKYWTQVGKSHWERETLKQKKEDCLKEQIRLQNRCILDKQLKELELKRENERLEKVREAEVINATIHEIRLEEVARKYSPLDKQKSELRQDLLDMIQKKKERRQAEAEEAKAEQLKIIAELQQIEAEENAEALQRKRALHNATLDYIQFVRRIRQFEKERDIVRDSRIDDLRRVDVCTKGNLQAERDRKAKIAAQCYAELKTQMCYQLSRRWHEENERRNYKMVVNPFGKTEPTRAAILAQRQKNREELDKQVMELKKIRAQQEADYENELQRADYDEDFCKELATKYMAEGIDYLPAHPNWRRIDSCATKTGVLRLKEPSHLVPPARSAKYHLSSSMEKNMVDSQTGQGLNCIEPCGCKHRRPF